MFQLSFFRNVVTSLAVEKSAEQLTTASSNVILKREVFFRFIRKDQLIYVDGDRGMREGRGGREGE